MTILKIILAIIIASFAIVAHSQVFLEFGKRQERINITALPSCQYGYCDPTPYAFSCEDNYGDGYF